jgi:hypothetical protein
MTRAMTKETGKFPQHKPKTLPMDTSIYLAIPGFGFSAGLQFRGFKTSLE